MALPKQVLLPPEEVARVHGEHSYHYEAWRYILGTLRALPEIAVGFGERLGMPCWSAYELSVDGVPVAVDISDYVLVDPAVGAFQHWLRFTYTPMFAPFRNIGAFPITSFLDWDQYARLAAGLAYDATGERIVFGQDEAAGENLPSRKTERRQYVRRTLTARVGNCLDDAWTGREAYWRRAAKSLVTVCVPGADNHHLDRGQHQLFGLGVCTISSDLFMAPLEKRPIAGEHYVACRDDYADLIDQIEWCRAHREACRQIGRRAQEFFQRHSTPRAIWRYIGQRLAAS
ncbi:MAG TPA: glycosyl transferase family 90 [Pirellulales bacterium]|nr:glycosyl transferase family 90 [Pirellulales bacterium]